MLNESPNQSFERVDAQTLPDCTEQCRHCWLFLEKEDEIFWQGMGGLPADIVPQAHRLCLSGEPRKSLAEAPSQERTFAVETPQLVASCRAKTFKIKNILLVDDEELLCRCLKAFLDDSDYHVEFATDGASALRRIQSHAPDLLILDLNMPGVSGYEVLHRTALSHPEIPKLILSGVGDVNEAILSIREGAWDFISKPIPDMTLLLHKINELEDKARLLKENRRHQERLEELVEIKTADVRRLSHELINTQKDIVVKLADVIETRSNETGNHVRRVAQMSAYLATEYGLPASQTEILKMASPLHDVGKVGISDSILNKPGKLTEAEFETIKSHTTIGYNMLNSSKQPIIQAAAIIAHQHHEYWDGSGYPRKLQGQDIHVFGRITCLVDVYDALRQKRTYKDQWSMPETIEFIKEKSGKMFDPDLVDIFLKHISEIERVIQEIGRQDLNFCEG